MKKFKLVTLLGIRPDIIRMHKLIKLLDENAASKRYEHIFAHTGQHFDYELDGIFYEELNVRKPDINFSIGKELQESHTKTSFEYQTGLLFQKLSAFIEKSKPDALMYLGDTNTVISSIIPARYSIPVIHIEAGGRSYDWRMPEEKCRIIIDHMSDALYSYLPRYKDILISEGIDEKRITVTGNIIHDAVDEFLPKALKKNTLSDLNISEKSYILVTLHREEHIADKKGLTEKVHDLVTLSSDYPIIFPLMPRMKNKLKEYDLLSLLEKSEIITPQPFGFFDFLKLEHDARLIITDSGTVQEEALILGVPCLVTRRSTERPETIHAGATILAEHKLYDNAQQALTMSADWDRSVLNPYQTSPSDVIYSDLMEKISANYFQMSRRYAALSPNSFVRSAYNKK